MQNYEERSIPLILRSESKKYEVNPEALQFFQSIEGKIAIISVAGIYRTGKSFLLNTILLNQKQGFAVGPTTNPKTKGIWVWGKPLILKNENDEIINVCVLDSEGLGSTEEDINHDLRLFSITLLLSSTFLYNTLGSIDENAIDSLGLVLRLCENLKTEDYNDFPDFYWILRDFSLALVGKDNNPLTTKMYLQNCLSAQSGDSQVRNKIRQSIRSSFLNRYCSTFVRPLTDQSCLQNLDKMQLHQLRPQFVQQVIAFRKTIFNNIKTKRLKGKQITTPILIQLIKLYIAQINSDKLPVIQTGWNYVCKRQCESAMDDIEKQIDEIVLKMADNLPTNKKDLQKEEESIYEKLKSKFELRTNNNQLAQQWLPSIGSLLNKKMKKIQLDMKSRNAQQTKNFIKREFENIQRMLKQNQFKSMGEMVKQFQLFYEFYRKKCPFKDEIQTGLELLMKKFSDCSLIMYKNMKNIKESEVVKLKQQLEQRTAELVSKDEKYKQQRTALHDRMAILQSQSDELTRQNKSLTETVNKIQQQQQKQQNELQNSRFQQREQFELQTITARKKILELEDTMKEMECQKNMSVNTLKNTLMLKKNEIVHANEKIVALNSKLAALSLTMNACEGEKQKKIDTLVVQLQKLQQSLSNELKVMKQELSKRDFQIQSLQAVLQTKCEDLSRVVQEHTRKMTIKTDQFKHQKDQLQSNYKDKIKALQDIIVGNQAELALKIRKSEADFTQKQLDLKMHKLQIDRQKAILNQKIDFLRKQCEEKDDKITRIVQQNNYYTTICEEKDSSILEISNAFEQLKTSHENSVAELTSKIDTLNSQLNEKIREIVQLESQKQSLENELSETKQGLKLTEQKYKFLTKNSEQKMRQLNDTLLYNQQNLQKLKTLYECQLQSLKAENCKSLQDQKRSAQLSLVQLKNYYEMQRERLQKRILQQRKKHQYSESSVIQDMENKYKKVTREMQEQLTNLKTKLEEREQQLVKFENECELKLMNLEQQRENQKRTTKSRYDVLQKKYLETEQELALFQKTHDEQRINFVKRIQSLNFEISRKEKDIAQLVIKREAAEAMLIKKDLQIDNIKKMMNQEIDGTMKKLESSQGKYQKLNEEYMQLKIESEKEIALAKQRNEFLNAKLAELVKQKEVGSSRNLQKLDKQKISDLKEQAEKYKIDLLNIEAKLQTNRKTMKEAETNFKKQIMQLEKQNQFQTQKIEINESKIIDLEGKIAMKNETFMKQIEQLREKNQNQRVEFQRQLDALRDKLSLTEDQLSETEWKLQKDVTLLNDRIKYAQHQRDQAKRELEESEKKLQLAFTQLKKSSQKSTEQNQAKKSINQKKFNSQIEILKQTHRMKLDQYEQSNKKLRDELKQYKQKIIDISQKLHRAEKSKNIQKSLQDQNDTLKRQKDILITTHRSQKTKLEQDYKKKLTELQRKNKQIQRANNNFSFTIEKQQTKWQMERKNMMDKITNLEDTLDYERNKSQLGKSKVELRKSQSMFLGNSTSELSKFSWKQ